MFTDILKQSISLSILDIKNKKWNKLKPFSTMKRRYDIYESPLQEIKSSIKHIRELNKKQIFMIIKSFILTSAYIGSMLAQPFFQGL